MKTIIIDEYEAKPVMKHPTGNYMLAFETPDGETYVFPMSEEHADQYHEALGDVLGKARGPKIHMPTGSDVSAAARTRR